MRHAARAKHRHPRIGIPSGNALGHRATHIKAALGRRLVGREERVGNDGHIRNHLVAHDLAVDEAKSMANAAVPMVLMPGQLVGAGDVKAITDQIANQAIGKTGVNRVFGIDRRFVPSLRFMDARWMQRNLLLCGRLVPHRGPVEHGEGRHQRFGKKLLLVVAKNHGHIGLGLREDVGHFFYGNSARGVAPGSLGQRAFFCKAFVLAQLHQLVKTVFAPLETVGAVGLVSGQAQQPLLRRRGQHGAMRRPHSEHDLCHLKTPWPGASRKPL